MIITEEQYKLVQMACPAAFYKPNTPAPTEWIQEQGGMPGTRSAGDTAWFESDAILRVSAGGNRAGKTTKLVLETGAFCVGFRPWYRPSNEWFQRGLKLNSDGEPLPARCRYVVPNLGEHLPEVIKELKKWWPADWWRVISRSDRGTPREIEFFNGSIIHFMSHHMEKKDFEGIEADWIAWDEPPPEKIYVGLNRGTVSTGGRIGVGATDLDATGWFCEEVLEPAASCEDGTAFVTYHSIWDNTCENGGCPEQKAAAVKFWLGQIGDIDERLAREHGYPMHVGGLIISGYDADKTIIDPEEMEVPADAYIVSAIDPAGSKPFAAVWIAYILHEDGSWEGHIFDETYDTRTRNDLALFGAIWKKKESGKEWPIHPGPSAAILIDPFANETQKADATGRTMREILADDYGIDTILANRQGKRARLVQLNDRVRTGRYKIWRNCKRVLRERRLWSWDLKSAKLTKGLDDCWDCISYIDAMDPAKMLGAKEGEVAPGVFAPGQYHVAPKTKDGFRKAGAFTYKEG